MNIRALLPRHARYRPDHLAVVFEGQRLTYREFNARVNRLANALLRAGSRRATRSPPGSGPKLAAAQAAALRA
jgi:long-chain acyl-CoA synthetase